MPGKYKTYTPEFREEAARMVIETSDAIADMAREAGISGTSRGTGSGPAGRSTRPRPAGPRGQGAIPPGLPQVTADPPILERVIANLTANALRYSPQRLSSPLTTCIRTAGSTAGSRPRAGYPQAYRGRMLSPSGGLATLATAPGSGSGWRCPAA